MKLLVAVYSAVLPLAGASCTAGDAKRAIDITAASAEPLHRLDSGPPDPEDPLRRFSLAQMEKTWQSTGGKTSTGATFKEIRDLVVIDGGRLVVLDGQAKAIYLLDAEGTIRATAGKPGRAAGELMAPQGLAVAITGEVYVGDRATNRVSVFRIANDSLHFVRAFSIGVTPVDLCLLGDRLYVNAGWDFEETKGVVHAFGTDGRRYATFGRAFPSPVETLRGTMSEGLVACHPSRGLIAHLPHLTANIRTYSHDGTLRWADTLPSFRQSPARAMENGGAQFDFFPVAGAHIGVSLVTVDDTSLLVQVALRDRSRKAPFDYRAIHSYLYSLTSGRLRGSTNALPVIWAVVGPHAYGVANFPEATITKYTLSQTGGSQ